MYLGLRFRLRRPLSGHSRPKDRALSLFFAAVVLVLSSPALQSAPRLHPATAADFFVAVNGRDDWSGRFAKPNANGTDGPFATLARARDAVRELKQTSANTNLLVLFRGGAYRLTQTVVFSLEDSAPERGKITYAAFPDEKPIFGSGVPVRNWTKADNDPPGLSAAAHGKLWIADMPSELSHFLTLYDGTRRLPRARGTGFAPTEYADRKTSAANRFRFPPGALYNFSNLKDAELAIIPAANYEMCILPLATINEQTRIVTTAAPASRPMGKVQFFPVSAWVENIFEGLDEPGEWVVDSVRRKIYLWPTGRQPGQEIVVPALTELVRVEGAIDYKGPKDQPVRGLVFRGLTFTAAERFPWNGGGGLGLQHYWETFDQPTAALRFRGAEDCAVRECRFIATSGTAIRLDLHCQRVRILDNEIGHTGGVGVLFAGYGPGTKNVNHDNELANNWIHHTGEIYWATPAVMIWQSGSNHVAHNLIHNTPYSGITISTRTGLSRRRDSLMVRTAEIGDPRAYPDWAAQEKFLHARDNLIEHNDIHHVMQVLADGDGIYISGTGTRNHIYQNFIHDCDSDKMADGIRCDDFQDGVIIEGNIIWNIRRVGQGICSKGVNHIFNNIIADLLPSRLAISPANVVRGYIGLEVNPVAGSRIERNLIISLRNEDPPVLQHIRYGTGLAPRLRDCQADYNLYYCASDPAWGRKHLDQEQPFGVEAHSISVDPLFVNPAKGDFRLKPGSPAFALGFQPIDPSLMGLLPHHPFYHR